MHPSYPYLRAETEYFLSEKPEAGGSIPIGMLTSGEGFAAEKGRFMAVREG